MNQAQNDAAVQQSLERLAKLLTPARARIALVSGRPILTAAQAGAMAVVGLRTRTPKTWVSVFIYATWSEATVGLRAVEATVGSTTGKHVIRALNGRMALFGWGAVEGETAQNTRFVLENILAAFEED